MTIADRANFGPTSHQQEAVQRFDRAWQQAQEQAKSAAWDTFGAAHYPFQDPTEFAQAVGDFAEDAIKAAANNIRDTYGAAKQWWNEITSMTHTPCEDKWTVIIETALPAAGDAMYLLLTPSPEEILENYLQPYPSKSSRRGAKGDRANKRKRSRSGKVRRSWPNVPDVDSWAAAVIPGAAMMKGRKAGAPTRWAFDAIDRLDRVAWWFLVIDVTKTFFNVWSSGMREARFCSQPWTFIAVDDIDSGFLSEWQINSGNMLHSETILKNLTRFNARYRAAPPPGISSQMYGTFSASQQLSWQKAPSNPDTLLWLRVEEYNSPTGTRITDGPKVSPTANAASLSVHHALSGGTNVVVTTRFSPSLIGQKNPKFTANISLFANNQ